MEYKEVIIPNCANIYAIGWRKDDVKFESTANYTQCIMCKSNDQLAITTIEHFFEEFKIDIENIYNNSPSNGWTPSTTDRVWWVTVDTSSAILSLHVKSSVNAVHQHDYLYNCFKSQGEAQQLLDILNPKINQLLEKIDTSYMKQKQSAD